MYNQYRPKNRASHIVAAAAALVTVLWLFDFVAALGVIQPLPSGEAQASASSQATG